MKDFKNDWYILILLKYKKKKSLWNKFQIWWLKRNNPSFKENVDYIIMLSNKGYLEDLSGWETEYDPETGGFTERPIDRPEVLQTSRIGEKAIFSHELKSESTENFFDKTFVRWGAIIGGVYSLVMIIIKFFSYLKNNFFQ